MTSPHSLSLSLSLPSLICLYLALSLSLDRQIAIPNQLKLQSISWNQDQVTAEMCCAAVMSCAAVM